MGRHADAGRTRGVARWVITAVVVVLVLAAVTVGYLVIVNRADTASEGACTGSATLQVTVGPDAAAAVTKAAAAYNATKPVARSTCVTAAVTQVPDAIALEGLLGRWPDAAGRAPELWIPDNAAALAALDAAQPAVAAGHPTDPVAWSPVVLAVRTADVPAVAHLAWSDLPLAAGPHGSAALPGGRHLVLAMPPVKSSEATSYAIQSVLAARDRTDALDRATVTSAAGTVAGIGRDAAGSPATTAAALASLVAGTGSATAVPVVEATLAAFDSGSGAAGSGGLTAVHPKGPTAGDALVTAPITASWVDRTTAAAASTFEAYLASPAGQQILADHGWRTASAHPSTPVAGVDVTAAVTQFPAADPTVDAAIAAALGQPAPEVPPSSTTSAAPTRGSTVPTTPTPTTSTTRTPSTSTPTKSTPTTRTATTTATPNAASRGPVVTVLVDTSSPMSAVTGGRSLLAWVQRGLPSVLGGSVTDRAGLWSYSDTGDLPPNGYSDLVSTGPLNATVGGRPRSAAIKAAIAGLKAGGDRWAYGALIAALAKVPDASVANRQSRIVLITSGVDQTPATPRQMVLDAESKVKGAVRVDVIGLGGAVPVEAYRAIATAGGGTYVPVTDPARLGRALTDLLTPSR